MSKLFKALDKIRPAYEMTDKIVMFICKILLIADICISGYAVCGRLLHDYIPFLKDPAWTEEVVLTLMSYMAVLSAALAIRHEKHIRMDAFDSFLPEKVKLVLDIAADVAVLALGLIMLISGWKYASTIGARGTYVSMMWLSRFWMYFPIPLAGLAMVIFELERILEHLKKAFVKEEADV
jgi:TRAP-type C4-dicarboxylate transport system permease small subunit